MLRYLKYVVLVGLALYIVHWMASAVKSRQKHEVAEALGSLLYVVLCFESFGHISGLSYWVAKTSAVQKALGGCLIAGASIVFVMSRQTLKHRGKPTDAWEATTVLIDKGVYSLIRHPMYFAALIAAGGVLLLRVSLISIVLGPAAMCCFCLAAIYEDKSNEEKFGESYQGYRKKTKLLIPFVF